MVTPPLIVSSPETPGDGRRISALTAAMDLMPTLMDLYGADLPPRVHGRSLSHLFAADETHHDAVLFGYFGKDIGLTDGRYTYCRQPLPGSRLHHHTAMPCAFSDFIGRDELARSECGAFLDSTHGIPHFRFEVDSHRHRDAPDFNPIYDILEDPGQQNHIHDDALEARLSAKMRELMERSDAPECQYSRVGL